MITPDLASDSMFCLVGPFPPPRHGVSAVNEGMASLASLSGVNVVRFNTSPKSLGTSLAVRASRWRGVVRAVRGVREFSRKHPSATVYLSVSGGWGMIYEVAIVRAARANGARVILHHNSFRYVDRHFAPMHWLAEGAGPEAIHVVLWPSMGQTLTIKYAAIKKLLVMSNAAWLPAPEDTPEHRGRGCNIVGHLSNLSVEKGILDVLDLAEQAQQRDSGLRFHVGGPFETSDVERTFKTRASSLRNLTYLGALYGSAKEQFFRGIDAFVFPTRYRNEAEPLVLHEAMAAGCPVIAYDRGCIGAFVSADCGALVPRADSFTTRALPLLEKWRADAERFSKVSRAAIAGFERSRNSGRQAQQALLDLVRSRELVGA